MYYQRYVYILCLKKTIHLTFDHKFGKINIDRFSKFFHWHRFSVDLKCLNGVLRKTIQLHGALLLTPRLGAVPLNSTGGLALIPNVYSQNVHYAISFKYATRIVHRTWAKTKVTRQETKTKRHFAIVRPDVLISFFLKLSSLRLVLRPVRCCEKSTAIKRRKSNGSLTIAFKARLSRGRRCAATDTTVKQAQCEFASKTMQLMMAAYNLFKSRLKKHFFHLASD